MRGGNGREPGSDDVQIRTFLIADVRGYTLFTQERGDEAAAKLAAKFADIAQEVVEARGGTLLELRGDEALCVFASTREAIRAAVDLQQRFVEETLADPALPLTVGIGIDAGEAVRVGDGYRGGALNLAARLCGVAKAGEILASREATHLARAVEGARYVDRGPMTFKNLPDPVSVVAVVPLDMDPVERLKPFGPAKAASSRRSRMPLLVAAAIVVVAVIAISLPLVSGGGGPLDLPSNSVARLDATDGSLQLEHALGERPGASAVGFGSLWVAEPDRGIVARLNLGTGAVVDTIQVGSSPAAIAVGDGSVWVANRDAGTLTRISPGTNEATQSLRAGAAPSAVAVDPDGHVWVADAIGATLLRIDPASGMSDPVPLTGQPVGLMQTADGIWVAVPPKSVSLVQRDQLATSVEATTGNGPSAVASGFGSLWVANQLDGSVSRVRTSTGAIESTIQVGAAPTSLAVAGGRVWVASEFGSRIVAIDPATNAVDRQISVGEPVTSITAQGDALWLTASASPSEHRGGTLTVASSDRAAPASLDPASQYDPLTWEILATTNDGLLGFDKVGGAEGATVVPDLAESLPQISEDGLTYRFVVRSDVRYSTGEPVKAEDIRYGLERAAVLSPDAPRIYAAIDGFEACQRQPTCDLSDSIVVDGDAITFNLTRPDTDLQYKLALPFADAVPSTVPFEDQGIAAFPATGPYEIGETAPDHITFERNPSFRVWSAAAQPDGFVDRIEWTYGNEVHESFDALQRGDVDLMAQPPGPEDLAILRTSHPEQLLTAPDPQVAFIGLDTAKPPFDDVRVRRALAYAIDRAHIVDLFGGPTAARVTCQVLPPNFQGYAPYCPYTTDPAAGVWSAPDLHRAQELIDEAGASGARLTVLVNDDPHATAAAAVTLRYVATVLRSLGLRPKLLVVEDSNDAFVRLYDVPGSPNHPNVFMTGWLADYPAAGGFIDPQFTCGSTGNAYGFCDRSLDRRIQRAHELQLTNIGEANRAWIGIEHTLVDELPQIPVMNLIKTSAISARTGNVQINPEWGVLLSRLWVR